VPPWLRQAAQDASTLRRQMEPYLPMMQDAQRYADEIRRATPLIQAAMQYAEQIRAAQAAVGPVLQALELVRLMNAGLYELLWPPRRRLDVSIPGRPGTVSVSALAGAIALSNAGAATDTLTVRGDSPADVGMPLDAKTVFLAIVWVFAMLLPVAILLLSPEVQTIIMDFVVTVGAALIIHWRVQDSRKHD